MFGGFFGEFLVSHGAVTPEQLEIAVHAQRENHVMLGALAVQKGYLTEARLDELLSRQKAEQRRFGVLAVENGYLTEAQLENLLGAQGGNHLYLGDALVREGILSPERLRELLDRYHVDQDALESQFSARITELPHSRLVQISLDMVRSFFFRMGFVLKIDEIRPGLPEDMESLDLFLGEQRLPGRERFYFGAALPGSAESLILRKITDGAGDRSWAERFEYLEQTFFNLNYAVCRESRATGVKAKHGPVHTTVPDGFAGTTFRFIGMVDPMYAITSARPAS